MSSVARQTKQIVGRASIQQVQKMLVGALLLGGSAYFIAVNAHLFGETGEGLGKYVDLRFVLLAHIAGGATALLTGPFQLWDTLRVKYKRLHRRMGMVYVLAIAVSGPCAMWLALTTAYAVGYAYAFSLQIWAGLWMTATALAYWFAWRKRFTLHKEWMTRSYLLSLAFVLSAFLAKVPFIASQGTFAEVSPGLFWLGWAVPLFAYDARLSAAR